MDNDKLSTIIQDCILAIDSARRVRKSIVDIRIELEPILQCHIDKSHTFNNSTEANIDKLDEIINSLRVVIKQLIDEV